MPSLSAWLFDVYPSGAGMLVWLLDEAGRMHALHDDDFTPCFYVRGPEDELAALTGWLRPRHDVALRRTARRDLFLDRELEVLEVAVRPPSRLPAVLRAAAEAFPNLVYYDADIPLPQRYVLARGVFPVALCQVEHDDKGRLRHITTLDTPWEIDYRLPPLRAMSLYLVNRHGEVVEGDRASSRLRRASSRPRTLEGHPEGGTPEEHPGRDPYDILDRMHLSRAFTCFQLAELIENAPAGPEPLFVLDLLATFYDESVPLRDSERLLATTLTHLRRLAAVGPVIVGGREPQTLVKERWLLLDQLQAAADAAWMLRLPAPQPSLQPRLFP